MRLRKVADVAVFVFGSLCHAQLSQINASNIVGGDGKKLAHGVIDFYPVTLWESHPIAVGRRPR
jgi:hypothetical protein